MNVITYATSINCPEIGFEHVLVFKTSKETINENGEPSKNTIKRKVQIAYAGRKGMLQKYQVFLFETECIFDHKLEPYHLLIRRLTYVFDEYFIGVAPNGIIVEVFNVEFIQYRWNKIRSKLMQEHEGEIVEQYMEEINDRVRDHDSILNYLQQLSMYGLYFNGYWNNGLPGKYFVDKEFNFEGQKHLLKEEMNVLNVSTELAEGIVLKVSGNVLDTAKQICINGKYQYINGILSEAESISVAESVKIKHSVSWVGLRKRL